MEDFSGKRILIMGLGSFGGGADAAAFFHKKGAGVTVTDLADEKKLAATLKKLAHLDGIQYHLGGHLDSDFTPENTDIIIVNPAVSEDNKYIASAKTAGVEISSQIEIFFRLCPADIIGITGSNGKSTTTALTAHLIAEGLKEKGSAGSVFLSGNIGNRPLLESLEQIKPADLIVLEISSFQALQLDNSKAAPQICVITNLSPNHLDRHGTFAEYCRAKETLIKNQKPERGRRPVTLLNADDEVCRNWYDKYSSEKDRICEFYRPEDTPENLRSVFKLPGRANLYNLAAARAAARQLGISDRSIAESLKTFTPLPDRLEFIAEKRGVSWYNDSISTTPQSTIAALNAFEEPVILIAGGYDKSLPFDEMALEITRKTRAAILIGATADKIEHQIKVSAPAFNVCRADSLENAVKTACEIADKGDIVVMSPACASYDMFENYRDRANTFITAVKAL